jgi:hypothetical protein
MTHHPRPALSIYVLILAAALRPMPAMAKEPAGSRELIKLLPVGTEIVCSCNVRQLLESPFLLKVIALPAVAADWKKLFWEDQEVSKQIQVLGLNIFKDISRITCAGKPGQPPIKIIEGLVVIEGSFQLGRLKARAEEAARKSGDSFKIGTSDGAELWEWSPKGKPEDRVYILPLSSRTLVLTGNKARLAGVADRATGKSKPELDAAMQALLEKADPGQTVTCVGKAGSVMAVVKAAIPIQVPWSFPRLRKLAGDCKALSVGLTLGEDAKFAIGMIAASPEAARKLRRRIDLLALGAAIAFTSIDAEDLKPWEDIVRSLRAKAEGSAVFVSGAVAGETVDKLLKMIRL